MQLTRMQSQMIYAAGYDVEREALEVVYFSGVYRYTGVPREVYEGLLAAESKGRYMHAHVLRRYPYELLRPEQQRDETNQLHDTPPL
jgi:hypothetical protein